LLGELNFDVFLGGLEFLVLIIALGELVCDLLELLGQLLGLDLQLLGQLLGFDLQLGDASS
jgi:hypothetical protein